MDIFYRRCSLKNEYKQRARYLMQNSGFIQEILKRISAINVDKQYSVDDHQLENFIKTVVNGDKIETHIVIQVSDKVLGRCIFAYILTNKRLLQILIDINGKIKSLPIPCSQITRVLFNAPQPKRLAVQISFNQGETGLEYSADDTSITDFFQRIDKRMI